MLFTIVVFSIGYFACFMHNKYERKITKEMQETTTKQGKDTSELLNTVFNSKMSFIEETQEYEKIRKDRATEISKLDKLIVDKEKEVVVLSNEVEKLEVEREKSQKEHKRWEALKKMASNQ